MRRPTLSLRVDQFEYVQLILLAVTVGVLAALGNLGFRKLIELFSWLFRVVEWNALGIEHGGIVDAPYGSGLSFRDPDGIALEFFAPPE